jgi:hypothetical protein
MMTPSQVIVREAVKTVATIDGKGRRLVLRRLTALDTLRLFKAAGPVLAQNEPWLSLAGLAFSLLEIDGVPVPTPTTEPQIESLIDRLGDEGLAAIADTIKVQEESSDPKSNMGNLPGTLS